MARFHLDARWLRQLGAWLYDVGQPDASKSFAILQSQADRCSHYIDQSIECWEQISGLETELSLARLEASKVREELAHFLRAKKSTKRAAAPVKEVPQRPRRRGAARPTSPGSSKA